MTMTPEQIRNHVNEVWEDNFGTLRHPKYVGTYLVVYEINGRELVDESHVFLANNNLPQSLRKAKPRMVKAPEWRLWVAAKHCKTGIGWALYRCHSDENEAKSMANEAMATWQHVAIQAPNSDEMEVVKGFENV